MTSTSRVRVEPSISEVRTEGAHTSQQVITKKHRVPMKTKQPAGAKKQTIIVKDLKTSKNPKGGFYKIKFEEVLVSSCSRDTKRK